MEHSADEVPGRDEVVVVTGAGGMGEAIARRIGGGRRVVLADYAAEALERTATSLRDGGYDVVEVVTDVADEESVTRLAEVAAEAGRIAAVVHTAGVSAATATVAQIVAVDLLGSARMIDAFEPVAERGTSFVCVASMAGHHAQLDAEAERALATTPTADLLDLPVVRALEGGEATRAYIVAKRANQVRVQAAALAWNRRGARINTVSPGVISTAMARAEAAGESGAHMLGMLQACGIGRMGSTGELAEAVAFLAGSQSRYVTGTDLLVDGGQAAWLRWHSGYAADS